MNDASRITYYEKLIILSITFFAFAIRIWNLGDMPPGWRDDELINSLVISQHVLDGEWALYYADASGHEALYHVLNAFFLGVFGANWVGIRLLSVFLGVLAVPVTWLLGRKLFGPWVGLLSAAGLTLSFWSLMYSRIGLRHVLMPLLTLLAFLFLLARIGDRGTGIGAQGSANSSLQSPIPDPQFCCCGRFYGARFLHLFCFTWRARHFVGFYRLLSHRRLEFI